MKVHMGLECQSLRLHCLIESEFGRDCLVTVEILDTCALSCVATHCWILWDTVIGPAFEEVTYFVVKCNF